MDQRQIIEFDRLFELSGAKTKTEFILAAIFYKTIKSVKIDKSAFDYYIKLTNLQSQYRSIGDRLSYIGSQGMGALEYEPFLYIRLKRICFIDKTDFHRLFFLTT